MATKSNSQHAFAVELPSLEMHWISEGGRLRSVWVASQPETFDFNQPQGVAELKGSTESGAKRAA